MVEIARPASIDLWSTEGRNDPAGGNNTCSADDFENGRGGQSCGGRDTSCRDKVFLSAEGQ